MATKGRALDKARMVKEDEFYTPLQEIEKELRHYRKHFKGKVVFCNCDDPFESEFFKYFVLNFNRLGLKQLIATCYSGSPIAGEQLSLFDISGNEEDAGKPYKAVVNKVYDANGDGGITMVDIAELFKSGENELTELSGNGDFRSPECVELLSQCDIVVTNPPFSLFREYITTLMEHKKQFLVIGNQNAITYKEVFPLLKENKVWIGYKFGDMAFKVPDHYEPRETRYWQDETGQKWRSLGNVCWFTNLDIKKRHEELILVMKYDPSRYPKYENYDAIEVSRVSDIPCDYEGAMGVPVTFLDKFNPEQFELIGLGHANLGVDMGIKPYDRELKKLNKGLRDGDLFYMDNGFPKVPYTRAVIRNKHPEPRG